MSILLGAVAGSRAARVPPILPDIMLVDSYTVSTEDTGSSGWTQADKILGPETEDRYLFIVMSYSMGGVTGSTVSGLTVNGNAATEILRAGAGSQRENVIIYGLALPTGETGTLAFTSTITTDAGYGVAIYSCPNGEPDILDTFTSTDSNNGQGYAWPVENAYIIGAAVDTASGRRFFGLDPMDLPQDPVSDSSYVPSIGRQAISGPDVAGGKWYNGTVSRAKAAFLALDLPSMIPELVPEQAWSPGAQDQITFETSTTAAGGGTLRVRGYRAPHDMVLETINIALSADPGRGLIAYFVGVGDTSNAGDMTIIYGATWGDSWDSLTNIMTHTLTDPIPVEAGKYVWVGWLVSPSTPEYRQTSESYRRGHLSSALTWAWTSTSATFGVPMNPTGMTNAAATAYGTWATGRLKDPLPDPVLFPTPLYHFAADQDVFSDVAGTTPADPGDPVALWGNLGAGQDAVQNTLARRPILRDGGLNDMPYLECVFASQQYFEDLPFAIPGGTSTVRPATLVVVADAVDTGVGSIAIIGNSLTNTGKFGMYYRVGASAEHHWIKSNWRIGTIVNPHILVFQIGRNANGNPANPYARAWMRQNGADIYSDVSQTGSVTTTAITDFQFLRAAGAFTGDGYFNGHLYEFMLFDRTLNNDQVAHIEELLADKYGITLP